MLRGLVVYKHDSGEIGKEKIRDTFALGLTDRSDELVVDGNRYVYIIYMDCKLAHRKTRRYTVTERHLVQLCSRGQWGAPADIFQYLRNSY